MKWRRNIPAPRASISESRLGFSFIRAFDQKCAKYFECLYFVFWNNDLEWNWNDIMPYLDTWGRLNFLETTFMTVFHSLTPSIQKYTMPMLPTEEGKNAGQK